MMGKFYGIEKRFSGHFAPKLKLNLKENVKNIYILLQIGFTIIFVMLLQAVSAKEREYFLHMRPLAKI